MISLIRELFNKRKIKNYSSTTTSAEEGHNSKKSFDKEIESIVKKATNREDITNIELNKLSSFYFNTPNISSGVFSLNENMLRGTVFEIKRVDSVLDSNGDIENMCIVLKEITLNNELSVTVSVKDFHEIFNHIQLKQLTKGK